jgi:hypothetical protein
MTSLTHTSIVCRFKLTGSWPPWYWCCSGNQYWCYWTDKYLQTVWPATLAIVWAQCYRAAITCVNRQAVRWQPPIRITCLSAEIISQPGVQPAVRALQNVDGAWLRFATDVMPEECPRYYCQINCGACVYIYIYIDREEERAVSVHLCLWFLCYRYRSSSRPIALNWYTAQKYFS